jgi:hypothetical protein
MVDFNHPLAGKNVVYEIHALRKIEDLDEKIRSVVEFLFRREFRFSVQENKVVIEVEKQMFKFAEMFKERFKAILGMEMEIKEIEATKESKSQ